MHSHSFHIVFEQQPDDESLVHVEDSLRLR